MRTQLCLVVAISLGVTVALGLNVAPQRASIHASDVATLRNARAHVQALGKAEADFVGTMSCSTCQFAVAMVVDVFSHPALENATKAMALAKCASHTTAKAKLDCEVAVAIVWKLVPLVIKEVDRLSWNMPPTICAVAFHACTEPCCTTPTTPEQIHLNYADGYNLNHMAVTWVTLNPVASPLVALSNGQTFPAVTRTYTAGGWVGTIYSAVMYNLAPGSNYSYKVGSVLQNAMSQEFQFVTLPTNIGTPARPLRILNVADMGYGPKSTQNIDRMTALVKAGGADVMVHNGDVGYADGDMHHWDLFMNKIQPIASQIPYMTTPGNHEIWFNFSAYKARFADSMPQPAGLPSGSMYYPLKIGPVTILLMDSETEIDTPDIPPVQVGWATGQINTANLDRPKNPFVLAFHHRPLYCKNHHTDCGIFADILKGQVEALYVGGKVDLVLNAHVHYYLRTFPVAYGNVTNTSYTNPDAPVYVVNGAAGNRESNPNPVPFEKPFAKGTGDIGYSVIEITSDAKSRKHSLNYRFILAADNSVFDSFTIVKDL